MTDKVRGVVIVDYDDSDVEEIVDSPKPTHLLVPVEMVKDATGEGDWIVGIPDGVIERCPTCGGSGATWNLDDREPDGPVPSKPCPDCINGWVIGGDDE